MHLRYLIDDFVGFFTSTQHSLLHFGKPKDHLPGYGPTPKQMPKRGPGRPPRAYLGKREREVFTSMMHCCAQRERERSFYIQHFLVPVCKVERPVFKCIILIPVPADLVLKRQKVQCFWYLRGKKVEALANVRTDMPTPVPTRRCRGLGPTLCYNFDQHVHHSRYVIKCWCQQLLQFVQWCLWHSNSFSWGGSDNLVGVEILIQIHPLCIISS